MKFIFWIPNPHNIHVLEGHLTTTVGKCNGNLSRAVLKSLIKCLENWLSGMLKFWIDRGIISPRRILNLVTKHFNRKQLWKSVKIKFKGVSYFHCPIMWIWNCTSFWLVIERIFFCFRCGAWKAVRDFWPSAVTLTESHVYSSMTTTLCQAPMTRLWNFGTSPHRMNFWHLVKLDLFNFQQEKLI